MAANDLPSDPMPSDPAPSDAVPFEAVPFEAVPFEAVPFDTLSLSELEESAGELQRRIAVTLRGFGEQRADTPDAAGMTPRREVAALTAAIELAALTLAAVAAGGVAEAPRLDRHPTLVAALMYATPSIEALLQRLEQDRRLIASIARTLEPRLDEEHATPWGDRRLRRLLVEVLLGASAQCALALEARAGQAEV